MPYELTRNQSIDSLWKSPNLILSQCCGPDLLTGKGAGLSVVARPVFAGLDCAPGSYYSHIVSRTERLISSARIAVNSLSSRSGYYGLTEWMLLNKIEISAVQVSGSHNASLIMLEQDLADLAAIDAHTLNQLEIKLALPIIGKSTDAITPPYVFHKKSSLRRDLLTQALTCAVQKNGEDIGITGLVQSDRTHYENSFSGTEKL